MGFMATDDEKKNAVRGSYLIFRPEKIGWLDIISLFTLRRSLGCYKFVESDVDLRLRADYVSGLVAAIQKFLLSIEKPLAIAGRITEFILNLLALNGGLLCLIWRFITMSMEWPVKDSAKYKSVIGHIDGRLDLHKSDSLINHFSLMHPDLNPDDLKYMDLSMMASKIAYENAAYVENAVTNKWKMHFVGFYNCWNKFLNNHGTQAFIFCDKAEDASLIVVAFRGTQPFDARDWSTDIDLSWLKVGGILPDGFVHAGFLKALGLQDEKSFSKGFPEDLNYPEDKPVAYYVLRDTLKSLISKHKDAKIIITGHSLGAALSAIFPFILYYHSQTDILKAIRAVINYGQPRVGDHLFAFYMEKKVSKKYYRMVYRNDVVPRVPFDFPPIALFTHFGTCVYFDGWYKGQEVKDSPNPNYFDPLYQPRMYLNAWGDLFRGLVAAWVPGKDYKEPLVSIMYRGFGLIVPGVACHSPRDYLNAVRLAKIDTMIMV